MTAAGTSRRLAAYRRGWWAEVLVAALFSTRGYRIVARRWRSPFGEIDLIVRRGRVLAFVEVKTRGRAEDLGEVVMTRQRGRITRAARAFVAAHAEAQGLDTRFDAVLVAPWRWPRHVRDAWRADS